MTSVLAALRQAHAEKVMASAEVYREGPPRPVKRPAAARHAARPTSRAHRIATLNGAYGGAGGWLRPVKSWQLDPYGRRQPEPEFDGYTVHRHETYSQCGIAPLIGDYLP